MALVVKGLRYGLGFTSEAIHAARERSASHKKPSSSSSPSSPDASRANSSRDLAANTDYHGEDITYYGEVDYVDPVGDRRTSQTADVFYPSSWEYGDPLSYDEAAWALDDMTDYIDQPPPYQRAPTILPDEPEDVKIKKREAMVRELVTMAGPPPLYPQRLPCSVIIPQRRPKKKERGFVRAYAPVLEDCGIGEDLFLKFLDDLDKANKADKWLDVVFVAGAIVGCVPSTAAMAVSMVVQILAGTARELQSRHRGNTYLDRVNQDLLMPRGLYAMVMTFKNEVPGQQQGILSEVSSKIGQTLFSKEKLDIDQTVAKYSNPDPNKSKFKKGLDGIRVSSGKTHGNVELPEAAPLVYPYLDRLAEESARGDGGAGSGGFRNKMKGAGEWTGDYLDRRAHAMADAENPGTSLVVPSEQRAPMKSRFNDPNHPANSGSFISLLTGGHVPVPGIDKMLALGEGQLERLAQGQTPKVPKGAEINRTEGKIERVINKKMHEDVLYLLIVNLPTPEEVEASVAQLGDMVAQGGGGPRYG